MQKNQKIGNTLNEATLSGIVADCFIKNKEGNGPTAFVQLFTKSSLNTPGVFNKVEIPLDDTDTTDFFSKLPEKCHRINEKFKNGVSPAPEEMTRITVKGTLYVADDKSIILKADSVREALWEEIPVNTVRLMGKILSVVKNRNFAGFVINVEHENCLKTMEIIVSAKNNPQDYYNLTSGKLAKGNNVYVEGQLKCTQFSDEKTTNYSIEATKISLNRNKNIQINH